MTPDVPEPNQKMCLPWKLCSEGQQIPSLLHCLIDVCHLKWDTSEYFCLPFKALPKCFSSTAPTGIRFLLCCFFLLLPLGPNSSALFNPGKTRKWALLGGGVGFLSPILSACVPPAHPPGSPWANGEGQESPGGHSPRSEGAGWQRCEEPRELCLRNATSGLRKREKDLTPASTDCWSREHRGLRGLYSMHCLVCYWWSNSQSFYEHLLSSLFLRDLFYFITIYLI